MPTITGLRPSPAAGSLPTAAPAEASSAAGRVASTEHSTPPPSLPSRDSYDSGPARASSVPDRGFFDRTFGPAIERTLTAVANTLDKATGSGMYATLPTPEERARLAGRQDSLGDLLGAPAARVGVGESGAGR